MSAMRTSWVMTISSGLLLAGALVHHGYEADREQTSGMPGTLEIALLVVFLLALVVAVVTTARSERCAGLGTPRLTTPELVVMLVGLAASVFFLPASLLIVGAAGHVVWRTSRPVPGRV